MAVSRLPIPVDESTLNIHIQRQTLFVQIKIGYDILSFDALHNFCARVQKHRIPQSQAILLRVGEYWEDENGLFRVKKQKPYGKTTWNDYQRLLMSTMGRGVIIYPDCLLSMDDLQGWIDNQIAIQEKFEREGKRDIYPPRVEPYFSPDDIWQLVEEVDSNTIDYLLCAGLKGFGQKTIIAVREYFKKELPHLSPSGHYFLSVLTDMEDGKLKHNVKGWGIKRAQKLRDILLLPDNINLSLNGNITDKPYETGWLAFGEEFKKLLDWGMENNNGKLNSEIVTSSFNACMEKVKYLIEF
jgi:hypothetical protein